MAECECPNVKEPSEKPVCIITLGMAGSGKSTFVQVSLWKNAYLFEEYVI